MKKTVNALIAALSLTAWDHSFGQPAITKQPADQSVSLGANATFQVSATTTGGPLNIQWRFRAFDILNATNRTLLLTNVHGADAGEYTASLSDATGSITTRAARLEVDPAFTKITVGSIVTDVGTSLACAWADYNGDGWMDLFVANDSSTGPYKNALYRNGGDGTFTRIQTNTIANTLSATIAATWGDIDNDGNPDLLITLYDGTRSRLFHNEGQDVFTLISQSVATMQGGMHHGGVWGDIDGDGLLDLFVVNFRGPVDGATAKPNVLYRNLGGNQFEQLSFDVKTRDRDSSTSAAWCDFDGDGDLDLFVTNGGWVGNQNNDLYLNDHGTLRRLTNAVPALDGGFSESSAWGDYDNDGYPDLFVANTRLQDSPTRLNKNFLYHNSGDGTFTRITSGDIVDGTANSIGCAWADYDNDGYLDLFVANGEYSVQNNYLFHNNRDGTFSAIKSGSLANDGGASAGCAWADYDNDGFLDLFVSNIDTSGATKQRNFLYRNNGNSNSWLNLQLVGTVSNRSAIGAKVRLKSTIHGKTMWQLREISGGSGFGSQNDPRAHFGLGDATNAQVVRIEWPSGTVQEFADVPAKRFLTITEPSRMLAVATNGAPQFAVKGGRGLQYTIQVSSDLKTWSAGGALTITNINGTAAILNTNSMVTDRQFYRAVSP